MIRSQAAGLVALGIAAACWGLATVGTKFALAGFAPTALLLVALTSATLALWTVLVVRGYRPPGSWRRVAVLGLLEPGGADLAQTVGLDHTSAANASVLLGLESAFVVVLAAVVLRERIGLGVGLAIAIAIAGLFALNVDGTFGGLGYGDALVLLSALSAAGYTIVARGLPEDCDTLSVTAHQFGVATLAVLPLALARWSSGAEALPLDVAPRYWVAAALVGAIGLGASFLLYNWAIAVVPAGPSAVVINLIPVFGFAGAVLLLGEQVTAARATGAALVAASVALFAASEVREVRQLTMISDISRSSSELVPT